MKLTPKQEQAIDGIIGESHQGFFVYLGRLLGKQTATTKEEKHEVLRYIARKIGGLNEQGE